MAVVSLITAVLLVSFTGAMVATLFGRWPRPPGQTLADKDKVAIELDDSLMSSIPYRSQRS
jgi:hypothetical protein